MQEYNPEINYYAVLGVEESANTTAIRKAYRDLSLIWHPDKWDIDKQYPPDGQKRTYEEVEARYKYIDNAYKILIDKGLRERYDEERTQVKFIQALPIANSELFKAERKSIPTEKDFFAWIEEDARSYPESMFPKIQAEPPEVRKHFWQLIAGDKLTYRDLQTATVDRSYLWDAVFHNKIIAHHLATRKFGDGGFRFAGEVSTMDYRQAEYGPHRRYNWLESSWQEVSRSKRALNDRERFMLLILDRPVDLPPVQIDSEHRKRNIETSPYPLPGEGLCSIESNLMKQGAAWLISSLHDYMAKPEQIPFETFWQRMVYKSNIIFELPLIKEINKQFYKPIQAHIQKLDKTRDTREIARLTALCDEIEETLTNELEIWIQSNESDPEGWAKEMSKTADGPHAALFEKIKTMASKANLQESKREHKQGASQPQVPESPQNQHASTAPSSKPTASPSKDGLKESKQEQKKAQAQQPASPSVSFFARHPVMTSTAAVTGFTTAAFGAYMLMKYLNGEDPVSWLTTNTGMGTPADLAIILAAVFVVLVIAAGFLATKIANPPEKIQPAGVEHEPPVAASAPS